MCRDLFFISTNASNIVMNIHDDHNNEITSLQEVVGSEVLSC